MEEAVASPDIPIYREYYFTLQHFAELTRLGPLPTMTSTGSEEMTRWTREVSMPYRERAKPIDDEVTARMIAALANKRGEALAISLATLGGMDVQMPPAAVTKALLANFVSLPENTQWQWLTSNWPLIAAPEAEPILRALASGRGDIRDEALLRLIELDPAAARPIAIDRIRRADISRDAYHNERALLQLPDKTLPELDDALEANFEGGMYHADLLLARYASAAVAGRVKAFLDGGGLCNGPIVAYLDRVDPDYATALLTGFEARCSPIEIQGSEDLLMTPALEKQLIMALDAARPNGVRELLQNAGSVAAKQPLMDAMLQAREHPSPSGISTDSAWAAAILTGAGWVPTGDDFDRVLAACQSDNCRRSVDSLRSRMAEPVGIMPDVSPMGLYARVGPFMLRSAQQVRNKIAQYPEGTSFYIGVGYAGSWWAEQHTREFRQMVEAAGMKVVEEPPRPQAPR